MGIVLSVFHAQHETISPLYSKYLSFWKAHRLRLYLSAGTLLRFTDRSMICPADDTSLGSTCLSHILTPSRSLTARLRNLELHMTLDHHTLRVPIWKGELERRTVHSLAVPSLDTVIAILTLELHLMDEFSLEQARDDWSCQSAVLRATLEELGTWLLGVDCVRDVSIVEFPEGCRYRRARLRK